MASIEIEVGVKRRVPLLSWGRVAGRPEMTLEAHKNREYKQETVPPRWPVGVETCSCLI